MELWSVKIIDKYILMPQNIIWYSLQNHNRNRKRNEINNKKQSLINLRKCFIKFQNLPFIFLQVTHYK